MAFHIVKTILYTLLILFFIPCKSYVFNVDIFENSRLFCLGDIHLGMTNRYPHPKLSNKDLFRIHQKQANDLINFIKQFEFEDCLLIVEDLFDCHNVKYKKAFFEARQKCLRKNYSAIFDFLNEFCIKCNIKYTNVEFRQTAQLFFNFSEVPANEFLKDFEKIIEEINNYNDTEHLNQYYQNTLHNLLAKHKSFINLLYNNKDKFMNDIIKKINQKKAKENFLSDYRKLLDLKIVHTIYQNRNIKHIFLCSGSNHILRIKEILNKIGYKQIDTKEYSQFKPLNLNVILNKLDLKNEIIQQNSNSNVNNTLTLILIIITDLLLKLGYISIKRRQILAK